MIKTTLIVAGLGAAMLFVWGYYARSQFVASLDALERLVQAARAIALTSNATRDDLPPEVQALAARLGARADTQSSFVALHQEGLMWSAPGSKPMVFAARQSISLSAPDFMWRASFEPFDSVTVADYHVGASAGLEARVGGVIAVARNIGSQAVTRGELMRYLAELAWAPDAILLNKQIDWRVEDKETFIVGQGRGPDRVEVTLHLGGDGLIESMDTAARPAQEGKVIVDRPWGGMLWDYQARDGRTIPMQGEVYWVRDGKRFIYWRGRLTDWSMHG